VVHQDRAVDPYGLEQPSIVGDQQQGSVEVLEGRLQLLDGGQVEVIGGLVEHQAIRSLHAERSQQDPRPLPR